MSLFVKGMIVGFCLAAPVGPIAAICVQRTIAKRWISGVVSGLGAATADAVYGAVAAFGATIVSEFLITEHEWLQRVGGVILLVLGLRLLLMRPIERETSNGNGGRSLVGDFASTFVLTLTNPMTFVAFAAIFATMGIGAVRGQPMLTIELVGGVFAGSGAWWIILCAGAWALRRHFDFKRLVFVNRATGVFVIAVGLVYLFLKTSAEHAPTIPIPERLRAPTPAAGP